MLKSPVLIGAALASDFRQVVGMNPTTFWDIMSGFDVLAFSDWLQVPDNQSTEDCVRERYGERGLTIIRRIMTK